MKPGRPNPVDRI